MQRMGKMNLTDAERDKLLTATRSRTARVADVRRAKLILMLEEGQSRDTIMTGAATSCRLYLAGGASPPFCGCRCRSKPGGKDGVERPGFGDEGGRCDRAVPQSPGARRGVLRR